MFIFFKIFGPMHCQITFELDENKTNTYISVKCPSIIKQRETAYNTQ